MRSRKRNVIILVGVLAILSLTLFWSIRSCEEKIVSEYYIQEYYPKFDKFTDSQKKQYLNKLDNQTVKIKVEDLISMNQSYEKKLKHRSGYILELHIRDLENPDSYTYSFSKTKP